MRASQTKLGEDSKERLSVRDSRASLRQIADSLKDVKHEALLPHEDKEKKPVTPKKPIEKSKTESKEAQAEQAKLVSTQPKPPSAPVKKPGPPKPVKKPVVREWVDEDAPAVKPAAKGSVDKEPWNPAKKRQPGKSMLKGKKPTKKRRVRWIDEVVKGEKLPKYEGTGLQRNSGSMPGEGHPKRPSAEGAAVALGVKTEEKKDEPKKSPKEKKAPQTGDQPTSPKADTPTKEKKPPQTGDQQNSPKTDTPTKEKKPPPTGDKQNLSKPDTPTKEKKPPPTDEPASPKQEKKSPQSGEPLTKSPKEGIQPKPKATTAVTS